MITPTPVSIKCHNQVMRLTSLFLLFAFGASAQVANGVATSVSRTVTLTADEADFSVVAGTSLDTTQQQVTQVFYNAGITRLTLSGTTIGQVSDYSMNPPTVQTQMLYQFTFSVPAAGLKDAAKKMEALRTNPPDPLNSLQYTAALNASQATVDAMGQTVIPQLFADAQKKAQVLAAAAGLTLGGIKGVSQSSYSTGNALSWIGTSQLANSSSSTSSGLGIQYTYNASVNFSVAAQ